MEEILLPVGRAVNYSFRVEEAAKWDSEGFVTWLERELQRREWSEAELSRRLGGSSGTVNRWVRGERRPSPASCDVLADLFGVDVDLVLTLAGHRPKPAPAHSDDPKARLIAMIKRVKLTQDRLSGLEATLQSWLELDRKARGREGRKRS